MSDPNGGPSSSRSTRQRGVNSPRVATESPAMPINRDVRASESSEPSRRSQVSTAASSPVKPKRGRSKLAGGTKAVMSKESEETVEEETPRGRRKTKGSEEIEKETDKPISRRESRGQKKKKKEEKEEKEKEATAELSDEDDEMQETALPVERPTKRAARKSRQVPTPPLPPAPVVAAVGRRRSSRGGTAAKEEEEAAAERLKALKAEVAVDFQKALNNVRDLASMAALMKTLHQARKDMRKKSEKEGADEMEEPKMFEEENEAFEGENRDLVEKASASPHPSMRARSHSLEEEAAEEVPAGRRRRTTMIVQRVVTDEHARALVPNPFPFLPFDKVTVQLY